MAKRSSRLLRLNIWMNGLPVGYWEHTSRGEQLGYFEEWIADEQGRPLSLSLPFTPGNQVWKGDRVAAFFDNLLPDSDAIRLRLARRYKAESVAPFDLLATLGRDCVGAIQLLAPDLEPEALHSIQGEAIDEAGIAQLLRNVTAGMPLGQDERGDDLRLSIAGAQEKTALLRQGAQWLLPHGSTPTTHIFKLPLGLVGNMQADMRSSVENEWLCSKIVAAYGLPSAACEIARFEDQKVLVVERFDRRPASDASWIIRLPQEDLCQATGTPPLRKYQADGGPGIATIMNILAGSESAAQDRRNFFKTQIVFWLLAATDGHAKNFSLFLLPGGRFKATPLYDVLSAFPIMGKGRNKLPPSKAKLAMAIRGSENYYGLQQIQRRHWIAMAQQLGLGRELAESVIQETLDATERVLAEVAAQLPGDFPLDVAEAVFAGIRAQGGRLVAMPRG
ncbi:type II toxin-antitoxin system HipA family toxin [Uliginosibacterium flavum]|uniref:Type II toxin-antitoxin system HipA family toxin n=1 Tax=Uliginosibacterium flavum TaxID=1396831 RepID=A0ABV2THV1_9RHOO